jgi:hypothetical protein
VVQNDSDRRGSGARRAAANRPSEHNAADKRQQNDPHRDPNPKHRIMVGHDFAPSIVEA